MAYRPPNTHEPNTDKPKIEQTDVYRDGTAPKAAIRYGGRGATSIKDIEDATAARRRHSAELSRKPVGPQSLANHDSKR
jgi:hypothetical protein